MNLDKLREEIAADEGVKLEIYLDHLGLPTVGIGHLIRNNDPEYGLPVGTPITEERMKELFDADVQSVIEDCEKLFSGFDDLPEEVQHILANMMFNMGYNRLSQFKMLRAAIADADWIDAASQMLDSRWARQVPNRANRLIERMKAVA